MRWIDSDPALEPVLEEMQDADVLAVDTEADSLHSYYDKVCLIQVSFGAEDVLIDPLASMDISGFGRILAAPAIRKIFHGADYDLRILNRDFGFEIQNLVDTMICAQLLGEKGVGLAALLEKYFGVELDKSNQRADWAMRPLPTRMVEYAARDTRYLQDLAQRLEEQLTTLGRWSWAEEEFRRLEAIRHVPADPDQERYRRLKGISKLEPRNLEVLSRLHAWRDGVAQRLDRPPFKVAGNDALVEMATRIPTDRDALAAVPGISRYHMAKYSREILETIESALEVPESELPEKKKSKPWLRDDKLEKRIAKLKTVRDRVAGQLGIEPSVLAPKHVLAEVAADGVRTVEDLGGIEAMRDWQREVLGEALLQAIRS